MSAMRECTVRDPRVEGFVPGLADAVRAACVAGGVLSHIEIAGHGLYDLAGQAHTVDEAAAAGRSVLLVLWTHGQRWLVPGVAPKACFHCFQLWRLHGWTAGFTRDAARAAGDVPSVSPVGDAWVAASIAATAAHIGVMRSSPIGKARLLSVDHRIVDEHTFIRHPDCPRCTPLPDNTQPGAARMFVSASGSSHEPHEPHERREPSEPNERHEPRGLRGASLRTMASIVPPYAKDSRTGLVRRIAHRTATPMLGMRAATLYPFRDPLAVEEGFGRSGRSADDAIVALLEGIERFAGMRARGQRTVIKGRYAALQDRAVDPRAYILHAPEQREHPAFKLADYSPDTEYDWVWGYSFRRDGGVLVPLQLAYFGLGRSSHVTGGRFVYEISNGCALGSSMTEAALHGLLEAIERDAFLACWYSGREVDRVDARGCADPFVRAMLARLGAEGLDVEVYDIRCGLPPAAFAVRIVDPDMRFGPAALFAAGAHLDRDSALRAALAEAVTFIYNHDAAERAEKLRKGEALLDDPAAVTSMADHALQCWPRRALAERRFPTASGPARAWSAMPAFAEADRIRTAALLADLVDATLAVAADVIVIDQSFEPFASAGVRCAKVLAPGLLPMTFGHQHRRISLARLRQAAGRDIDADGRVRDDPHVFP